MKINEIGRSMVEMLGVLAIVGVLSAGALKGYSAAMFKYKMNQTIDTYNQILQRFMELEQKGWGEGIEIRDAEDLIQYGLLPDCQVTTDLNGDEACKLPIGTLNMDFYDSGGSYVQGEFVIHFTDSKSCIAFASAGWENAVPVEWWTGGLIEVGGKDIYWPTGGITEVKMSDIIEGCQACETSLDSCRFYHVIRGDY